MFSLSFCIGILSTCSDMRAITHPSDSVAPNPRASAWRLAALSMLFIIVVGRTRPRLSVRNVSAKNGKRSMFLFSTLVFL